jgi:hypothetical protein
VKAKEFDWKADLRLPGGVTLEEWNASQERRSAQLDKVIREINKKRAGK